MSLNNDNLDFNSLLNINYSILSNIELLNAPKIEIYMRRKSGRRADLDSNSCVTQSFKNRISKNRTIQLKLNNISNIHVKISNDSSFENALTLALTEDKKLASNELNFDSSTSSFFLIYNSTQNKSKHYIDFTFTPTNNQENIHCRIDNLYKGDHKHETGQKQKAFYNKTNNYLKYNKTTNQFDIININTSNT